MNGLGRITKQFMTSVKGFMRDYKIQPIEVPGTHNTVTGKSLVVNKIVPQDSHKGNKERVVIIIPGGAVWNYRSARAYGMFTTQSGNFKPADVYVMTSDFYVNLYDLRILDRLRICIDFIKSFYENATFHLVGVSVGGMVLAFYQAYGYNQANYYYHVASNISGRDFFHGINETYYMKFYKEFFRIMMNRHGCNTFDNRIVKFINFVKLEDKLKAVDLSTTTVVYGEEDPISQNVKYNYRNLNVKDIIEVKEGVHCCQRVATALSNAIC